MRTKTTHFAAMFVLLLCFAIPQSRAQYNHAHEANYFSGMYNLQLSGDAVDIVTADPNHQCVLSSLQNQSYLTGIFPCDFFISLKNIDMSGSTVWDMTHYFLDTFYKLEPVALIKTLDEGFIVVGRAVNYSSGSQPFANPFALKVDQNGNLQWANIYQSNYTRFSDSVQTTVTRVEDDTTGTESYIIVRSGTADPQHEHFTDVCINALKIDVNGTLLWNKKYRMQNRSNADSVVSDYPATITHVEDSASHYYFIAGTRRTTSATYSRDSALFYLGIDRDGRVVRPYRWLTCAWLSLQ